MSISVLNMICSVSLALLQPVRPDDSIRPLHGIYLSVVQIDHPAQGDEAAILIKVFTDDLQDVIRAAYPGEIRPAQGAQFISDNSALIGSYFQQHLSCRFNAGDAASLQWISGTPENEVYWLKFTLQVPKKWRELSIKAPFFTEVFPAQSNIIQLLHGSEKRFARLTKSEDEALFHF